MNDVTLTESRFQPDICVGGRMTFQENNWLSALCLSTAIAVLILISGPVPPMDDTYIHLVYGRSLLSGSPLSFNPGESSSGFTSPLWLIPSSLASLAGQMTAPALLMLISAIFAVSSLLALGSNKTTLLLISGPFLFHAGSGMETGMACLFVALIWKSLREPELNRLMPVLLAGAFLTRPELLVLGLPMLLNRAREGPKGVFGLLWPVLLVAALWALWNLYATGLPLPGTFYAKQTLPWITMLAQGMRGLLRDLLIISPLLIPAALISMVFLARKGRLEWLIPLLLGGAALATQPNNYFQMRYWVPFLFACGLSAGEWLGSAGRAKKKMRIVLTLSLLPGLVVFADRRIAASADVRAIDHDPAVLLDAMAEEDNTVAAADIGAVGWSTDLYILDLDGLITPDMLPRNGGTPEEQWQRIEQQADYLLAFPVQYSSLTEAAGQSLAEITTFTSPRNVICGEESVTLWRIIHEATTEAIGTETDTELFEANVNACRSNLRELAVAESMFFAANSTYCPIAELAASGFMDNACDLVCPSCEAAYTTVTCGPDGYSIVCMYDAIAHGSIENGMASWD